MTYDAGGLGNAITSAILVASHQFSDCVLTTTIVHPTFSQATGIVLLRNPTRHLRPAGDSDAGFNGTIVTAQLDLAATIRLFSHLIANANYFA